MKSTLFAICVAGAVFGQEGLFGPYFKTVAVNTKASGASVAADVVNFPLLVRLDASNAADILSQAKTDGGDIRITNAAGTDPLPFEIESWDAAAQKAVLWLLAPQIKGNDSSTVFRIYWGRAGAVSNSTPSAVFDTANGFQAVWHMNGTGDEPDATVNGFTATAVNSPPDTLGAIAGSRRFNGTSQYFVVTNSAAGKLDLPLTGAYTLSAWVYAEAVASGSANGNSIIDKSDNQYILHLYGNPGAKYWDMITRANNAFHQAGSESASLAVNPIGQWHWITGVHRGGAIGGTLAESLYVDGVPVNGISNEYKNNTGRNSALAVALGAHPGAASPTTYTRLWNGRLDEIRISNQARSGAWIKLEYATQRPGATAVRVGDPSVTSVAAGGAQASSPFRVRSAGGDLIVEFTESGPTRADLALTDVRGRAVWTAGMDPAVSRQLRWNPGSIPAGIYFLRARLLGPSGREVQVLHQKISLGL